jgi:hypothetical protein
MVRACSGSGGRGRVLVLHLTVLLVVVVKDPVFTVGSIVDGIPARLVRAPSRGSSAGTPLVVASLTEGGEGRSGGASPGLESVGPLEEAEQGASPCSSATRAGGTHHGGGRGCTTPTIDANPAPARGWRFSSSSGAA